MCGTTSDMEPSYLDEHMWRERYAEIYLLIAIFAIGEQISVLAKERCMHFVTSDENAKGQGCNSIGILHLILPWSFSS